MQKRITIFDTVRGFTMISMAGFHACYDLAYLYDWDMPWFTQTIFQDIWRASISWVFLFIIFKCLLRKIRLSFHRVGSRTTNDTIYTFSVYTFDHIDFVLY